MHPYMHSYFILAFPGILGAAICRAFFLARETPMREVLCVCSIHPCFELRVLCFQFFLAACELNVCFSTCISNVVYGFSICFYGVLAVPAPPKMQAYMHICSGLVRRGGPM